jgi:hypothetical protein
VWHDKDPSLLNALHAEQRPINLAALALYLKKTESSSPKDNLYQVWLNLACLFWRRFLKMYFYTFAITSPWRGTIPFI